MNRLDYMSRVPHWQDVWGRTIPGGGTVLERTLSYDLRQRWDVLMRSAGSTPNPSDVTAVALDLAYMDEVPQVDIRIGPAMQRFLLNGEPPGGLRDLARPYGANVVWFSTPHLNAAVCRADGVVSPDNVVRGFYLVRPSAEFPVFGGAGNGAWFFNVFAPNGPPARCTIEDMVSFSWGWEGTQATVTDAADALAARYAELHPDAEYSPRDLAVKVMRTAFGALAYLATPKPDVDESRPPVRPAARKKRAGRRAHKRTDARKAVRQNRVFMDPMPSLEREYAARAHHKGVSGRNSPYAHWVSPHWRTFWVTSAHPHWAFADESRQSEEGKRPLRVLVGEETGGFLRGKHMPDKVTIVT